MNRALEWSHGCQYVEIERLIEVPIDVLEHAMHPPLVLDATVARSHAAPNEV
jgi:hypothetical protein